MNDLISGQAAIDAIDKHIDTFDAIDTNYLCGLRTAMSFLKEMPPAQSKRETGGLVNRMDEMTLTLNSPITEEQWDALTDVDFDNTDEICFHTKHGKEVYFVKRKKGKWIDATIKHDSGELPIQVCDQCNTFFPLAYTGGGHRFCQNCGADMRGTHD